MEKLSAKADLDLIGYQLFCKFNRSRKKSYRLVNMRIYLLLIVLAAITLYMFIKGTYGTNSYLMLALSAIFTVYYLYILLLTPRKNYKIVKTAYEGKTFVMSEDTFEVHKGEEQSVYHYEDFFKAFEIKDYFIMYFTNAQGLLVSKAQFEQGAPEQFAEILKRQMGKFFERIE